MALEEEVGRRPEEEHEVFPSVRGVVVQVA